MEKSTKNWYCGVKSKWDEERLVEYLPGNSPIVITVPHGGKMSGGIPDRPGGCHVQDAYSMELALDLARCLTSILITNTLPIKIHASVLPSAPLDIEGIESHPIDSDRTLNQSPHVIISHLKRSKMDPNRGKDSACMGNETAEEAWEQYHGFIEKAITESCKTFGYVQIFDIHGQSHRPDAIELGYCLTCDDLEMSDNDLNDIASKMVQSAYGIENVHGDDFECSILTLHHRHKCACDHDCKCGSDRVCACCGTIKSNEFTRDQKVQISKALPTLSELIRGEHSLGTLLTNKGYPTVPSSDCPVVGGTYFWGAFTTRHYGLYYARNTCGCEKMPTHACVNVIQIEPPMYVRKPKERDNFAKTLSISIITWINHWYGKI